MTPYPRVQLQTFASIKGGKRLPKGEEFSEQETGHPYIRARDIKNGSIMFDKPVYLSAALAARLSRFTVVEGDVCITIVGANVGDVGAVPRSLHGANLTENAVKVLAKPGTDQGFLKYALLTPDAQDQMKVLAGGAAQPKLGIYKIKTIEIPTPSREVQRKIAAILSAYDDLIGNNLRRIQILEEMAQNLYREWFVKFRFPGHESVRMVDSELGEIPEGWGVIALGNLVEEVRDSVSPSELPGDTPYMGLEHLPRKSITLGNWGVAKDVDSTKLRFRAGDILFGKIRPYFHKVGIAPIQGICSSDTIVMRPTSEDSRWLALGCASSTEFVDHSTATSQGTKMPRANWKVLQQYAVAIPGPEIHTGFDRFMSNAVSQMQCLMFKNRVLRQTRDLLLPKLISGELDVSDLDISIPEEAA